MRKLRPRVRALNLAAKVRERLSEALGQPVEVIMYGSQARGDATKCSDIDLLVILPYLGADLRSLVSDIAWEVGFEAGRVISTIPTTEEKSNSLVSCHSIEISKERKSRYDRGAIAQGGAGAIQYRMERAYQTLRAAQVT